MQKWVLTLQAGRRHMIAQYVKALREKSSDLQPESLMGGRLKMNCEE